jgi:O-antigen/teichoic acid export membrane protein
LNQKNQESLFVCLRSNKELGKLTVKGGALSIASEGVSFLIKTAATMFLARHLMPENFGVVGMVLAITEFANLFRDLGLSDATIQKDQISKSQVSNLFWMNIVIGFALMLLVSASSIFVSNFYHDDRLVWITAALSITFFFNGSIVQHTAILRRNLKFDLLGIIKIAGTAIGTGTGLLLAYLKFEYWALVWMNIVNSLVTVILTWILCNWKPMMPTRRSDMRELLKFGGNITGFNVLNYFSRNLDNILIGKYNGAFALGIYQKAYQFMLLPISQLRTPITLVSLPVLSSLVKEPVRYRRYYYNIVFVFAFISMPCVVILGVYSDQVINLLLGPGWEQSAEIFKILAFAAFIQPVATTRGVAMISSGDTSRYLRWGAVNAVCLTITFFIGIAWGGIGIAIGYTIYTYLSLVPSLLYCFKKTNADIVLFFKAIHVPVFACITMFMLLYAIEHSGCLRNIGALFRASLSIVLSLTLYIALCAIFKSGRVQMIDLFSYCKKACFEKF